MYNTLGEDGIVELFLQQIEKSNNNIDNQIDTKLSKRIIKSVSNIVKRILIVLAVIGLLTGMSSHEYWYGKVLLSVLGLPILIWIIKRSWHVHIHWTAFCITISIGAIIIFFLGFYQLIAGINVWWPVFLEGTLGVIFWVIVILLFIIFSLIGYFS